MLCFEFLSKHILTFLLKPFDYFSMENKQHDFFLTSIIVSDLLEKFDVTLFITRSFKIYFKIIEKEIYNYKNSQIT